MLPLWIIDLGISAASEKKLQSLLGGLADSQKPFWHYFHPKTEAVKDTADVKALMEETVADGRNCYNAFINAGYPVGNFQIVVLGSAAEALSQQVFSPMAGLLRDSLPKIVSDHANLGVEITGILFIPGTINQLDSTSERQKAAMMLEDINTICEQLGSRHYNHVVAYQDVQYHGARFYAGLDDEQRTELLFQILSHIFLVDERSEKLFDRLSQESGIFSVGAASVFYDADSHRQHELSRLLNRLIEEFKDTENADDKYSEKKVEDILEEDVLEPEVVSARLREGCSSLEIDLKKMEGEADPHPVWDLFRSDLFPKYYRKYLKFMPARLLQFMQSLSYLLKMRFAGIMRKNREEAVDKLKLVIRSIYKKVYLDEASRFATIAQLESVFTKAKERLGGFRAKVEKVLLEIVPVPAYLRHDYDKCLADEESNSISALMDKLKKNLKKEPVVLSLLVRCFLLGILLVFTVIPLLRVVSPKVINLGELATIEWVWIPVLFLLPLIIEFFIKLRRHFKRIKRLKYRMLASVLLSVNKKLSEILFEEQGRFYDGVAEECDVQLALLRKFRSGLAVPESESKNELIPETMFNQPLIGGAFCGEKLLPDETYCEAEIRVKDDSVRVSVLEKEEVLSLLKGSFKNPETLSAGDLSDGKEVSEHTRLLIEILGIIFGPELHIHTAEDAGLMLRLLGGKFNVEALRKMAGVNGMLFSKPDGNRALVRITNAPDELSQYNVISDASTRNYVFLTSWQKISPAIQSQQVCNCSLDPLPALSISDKLTLYYAFYRKKDLAYTLAGMPLRIPKEDMAEIDKQIGG